MAEKESSLEEAHWKKKQESSINLKIEHFSGNLVSIRIMRFAGERTFAENFEVL